MDILAMCCMKGALSAASQKSMRLAGVLLSSPAHCLLYSRIATILTAQLCRLASSTCDRPSRFARLQVCVL